MFVHVFAIVFCVGMIFLLDPFPQQVLVGLHWGDDVLRSFVDYILVDILVVGFPFDDDDVEAMVEGDEVEAVAEVVEAVAVTGVVVVVVAHGVLVLDVVRCSLENRW